MKLRKIDLQVFCVVMSLNIMVASVDCFLAFQLLRIASV